jgi:arylsulfatase A
MKFFSALVFSLLVFGLCQAGARKPNFIFLMLDDAGYGDVSCFGQKHFETPNIDRMAKQGMKLTDFYASSTVCAPSRCSLMTGVHTGQAVVRGNHEIKPEGQFPLPKETLTIPKLLKQAGYTSGMFGKWGLGSPGSSGDPINQGFDRFFGYNCQRQSHTFFPPHLWSNQEKVPLDGKTYSHHLIADQALEFIRENQKKHFFCYLPFTMPHAAMHAPEELVEPWRKKFPQFNKIVGKYRPPNQKNPAAVFAAMMTLMDRDLGRILDLLEKTGIAEDTLVIFSSDNGPHQAGGHQPDFFDSNGPLRGYKRDLYEGGIRVPTVAWWPEKISAGSRTDIPFAGWDILPTFCELAGVESPNQVNGISFAPTLLGKPSVQESRKYLYWEFHEQGGKQAIRMGKWKGVRLQVRKNPAGPIELYNLYKDIGEQNNVASQFPKVVEEINRLFKEARNSNPNFPLLPGDR